ncbi:hypothetical protein ACFS33_19435 [Cellulomonas phragmiteti]|uniref:DprA-like winged helix domain-containing protein n=1 Tax=Cellulomonas phragmiteti TaxID=478780 RepID=UPI0036359DAF
MCVTDAAEVIELVGHVGPDLAPRRTGMRHAPRTASTAGRAVHDGLSRRTARDTSQVAARAGTTLAQARAMLGLLELEGLARRAASGWVVGDAHE